MSDAGARRPPSARSPHSPVSSVLRPVQRAVHHVRWTALRIRTLGRTSAASTPITAKGVTILRHARVRLATNVALGRHMYVETDLEVGDDVLFSGYVAVVGDVHPVDGPGTVFASRAERQPPVVLEGDNLVGYGAILIAPCHLERGAVVGAGAVVTGRLSADSVNVGVPARPIRQRRRALPEA